MSYYIDFPKRVNMGNQLLATKEAKARELNGPPMSIPEDKALIVIVRNLHYDSAGVGLNKGAMREWDSRGRGLKRWFLVDRQWALRKNPDLKKGA